jgi:hypothetical protein
MPTLSTILHEKKEDILELMSQFNFNVDSAQILCHVRPEELLTNSDPDEFPHTLYFVVEGVEHADMNNEKSPEHFADYLSLEVHLSEKLNCDVGILLLKDLQGIYWQPLLDYCVRISDEENKIAKLFNVTSLNNVQIDELNKEDKHFQHRQKLAHRKPEKTDEKKSLPKTPPHNLRSIFKRKSSDTDEFGYSSSPTSSIDNESDSEEAYVNKKMREIEGLNLPIKTLDKIIKKLQQLKQSKLSSEEKSKLDTKELPTNKI